MKSLVKKMFHEKHGIVQNEGILTSKVGYTKFFKASNQDPKLKYATTDQRGNSIILSKPNSSSKIIHLPKASISCHSSDVLLCLCLLLSLRVTIMLNSII